MMVTAMPILHVLQPAKLPWLLMVQLFIQLSKLLPLSSETLQLYRSLFRYARVLIIDEISMVSAELLHKIDNRLKQITGKNTDFGSIDVILIGYLRQLPPARSTPIYKILRA